MRLLRCHIENFGVLSGFDYEFPEGLAVICRENGFGKSTLAAFLKAMFYGLPRTGAHNVTENERRRFEPWQGGKIRRLSGIRVSGRCIPCDALLRKDSGEGYVFLRDLTRRTDETPFSSRLGEELFGLDAASFARSTYLPQAAEADMQATTSMRAKAFQSGRRHERHEQLRYRRAGTAPIPAESARLQRRQGRNCRL